MMKDICVCVCVCVCAYIGQTKIAFHAKPKDKVLSMMHNALCWMSVTSAAFMVCVPVSKLFHAPTSTNANIIPWRRGLCVSVGGGGGEEESRYVHTFPVPQPREW